MYGYYFLHYYYNGYYFLHCRVWESEAIINTNKPYSTNSSIYKSH